MVGEEMRSIGPSFVLLLAIAPGCGISDATFRMSSTVPHPAPITSAGRPMGSTIDEVRLGTATIALGTPSSSQDVSIFVPRAQMEAAYRHRLGDRFDGSLLYSHGIGNGAHAVGATAEQRTGRDVIGGGAALQTMIVQGTFSLAVAAQLVVYSIPFTAFPAFEGADRHPEVQLRAALLPSVQFGATTLFANVSAGNQVLTHREETFIETDGDAVSPSPQSFGGFAAVFGAGAEVDFGRFRAAIQVYEPVMVPAIHYLPAFGMMISVPLWDDANVRAHHRVLELEARALAARQSRRPVIPIGAGDATVATCQATCAAQAMRCTNGCDFGATYAVYGDPLVYQGDVTFPGILQSQSCEVQVRAEALVRGRVEQRTASGCCCEPPGGTP
jgi:hypothetical protein